MKYKIYVHAFYTDWSKNGLSYRLYGPAREYFYGKLWYINGIEYTEEEFKRIQSGKK